MPLSSRESRSEATARVTRALMAWLWGQGCRLLAPEVGLHPGRGLCTPWQGLWRVDMAAVWDRHTHLFEVKGTRADLARENLQQGKWVIDWRPRGLASWLVVDVHVLPLVTQPPAGWGLLVVSDAHTRVDREADKGADDVHFAEHCQALGTVLCLQSLPKLMGLDRAQRLVALDGHERPWRLWTAEASAWREDHEC